MQHGHRSACTAGESRSTVDSGALPDFGKLYRFLRPFDPYSVRTAFCIRNNKTLSVDELPALFWEAAAGFKPGYGTVFAHQLLITYERIKRVRKDVEI